MLAIYQQFNNLFFDRYKSSDVPPDPPGGFGTIGLSQPGGLGGGVPQFFVIGILLPLLLE